eukprot:5077212-Prymnesium_polylepis.4
MVQRGTVHPGCALHAEHSCLRQHPPLVVVAAEQLQLAVLAPNSGNDDLPGQEVACICHGLFALHPSTHCWLSCQRLADADTVTLLQHPVEGHVEELVFEKQVARLHMRNHVRRCWVSSL